MSILQKLGEGQGHLKAGFLGFQGSGKTYTAALLAIGLRKFLELDGPIAMFDTEGGSEYIAARIREETGQDLLGVKSRSLDDLLEVGRECEAGASPILIADSMTHVWRECCDAYLKQINQLRKSKNLGPRVRLEFQDWSTIKAKFAEWTDFYMNSALHIIICGRAGFEWEYIEQEDSSGNVRRELVKKNVKMKTENEFGFEPSLLVEMERIQEKDEKKQLTKRFIHRATILKDRFGDIDSASAEDPDFDFFLPHIKRLTPGAHAVVDTEVKSDLGVDEEGDNDWHREKKQRAILCEEIQGEILKAFPGRSDKDKLGKLDLLEEVFGTRSWTKVESTKAEELRHHLDMIRIRVLGIMADRKESKA
jgi:hypothetical protein